MQCMSKFQPDVNQFFDINKLPSGKGLILFPISMSRIETGQSPQVCMEYIKHLARDRVSTPTIGWNVLYSDLLYMNLVEGDARTAKNQFMHEVLKHKNALHKLFKKEHQTFQIQHGLHFDTWGRVYVGTKNFALRLRELRKRYDADERFQKYLQEDVSYFGREISDQQIEFFLEEHLMMYLTTKGEIVFDNDYIQHQEEWILMCYPGMPPKHLIYMYQQNFFELENIKNKYQNCFYDLEAKKLYDFDRVDLETLIYEIH